MSVDKRFNKTNQVANTVKHFTCLNSRSIARKFFTSLASLDCKIKLFMAVILLRGKFMFISVSVSHFQPFLTNVGKAESLPDKLENIRVG
jgi:hypothetical protein